MTGVIFYIVKYSVNPTNLKQNQNSYNKTPNFILVMEVCELLNIANC